MKPEVRIMKAATMPLTMVGLGQPVRLAGVDAGQGLQRRLVSMGLVPGAVLEVLSSSVGGPVVVAVNQTRIMLGRGMAHKIRVCET